MVTIRAIRAGLRDAATRISSPTATAPDAMVPEKRLFKYSVLYLFLMFAAVAADRWFA